MSNGLPRWVPKNDTLPGPTSAQVQVPGALTLTTTQPPGWERPTTPNRAYVFVTHGTLDGHLPSNLDTHVLELDTTATTATERRVCLKAVMVAPVSVNLGLGGVTLLWESVEIVTGTSAAIGASVPPPNGAADPVTGVLAHYIIPLGVARWQQIGGVWQLRLLNDDVGSVWSRKQNFYGSVVAGDGPDVPPAVQVVTEITFTRNGTP